MYFPVRRETEVPGVNLQVSYRFIIRHDVFSRKTVGY